MPSPLARDIAWLNDRLAEIIPADTGALVDRVRQAAGRMIDSEGVDAALTDLSADETYAVLKLLTTQFHLRNKAEQVHIARVNHQRERQSKDGKPRPESLDALIHRFAEAGLPLSRTLE